MKRYLIILAFSPLICLSQNTTKESYIELNNILWVFNNSAVSFSESTFDKEAQVYFNSVTPEISDTQKIKLNNIFIALKDSFNVESVADICDCMYALDNETSGAASNNLIKRAHDITPVNSPIYVPSHGFALNGTNQYLNTNFSDVDTSVYTKNDGSFGINYNTATDHTNFEFTGAWGSTASGGNANRVSLSVSNGFTGSASYAVNSGGGTAAMNKDITGLFIANRDNSETLQRFWVNKTSLASISRTTAEVPDQDVYLGALHNVNGSPLYYNNDTMGFAFLCKGLTFDEIADITDIINYYLNTNIVDYAMGYTQGSTEEIYLTTSSILDQTYTELESSVRLEQTDLDPTQKYVAVGWADFFNSDSDYTMPLTTKYGFSSTFYAQIVPDSNDYLTTTKYDVDKLDMIEESNSWRGHHGYMHIPYIYNNPSYDGLNYPSNYDLRHERIDGTNSMGNRVDSTLDQTLTAGIREFWLRLEDTTGAKTWAELDDAECELIRENVSVFSMKYDPQNQQKVLEGLDFLSNRYCGTTGYSVLGGDYDNRQPNTSGGVYPSPGNEIQGGVFQGSETTQNHEIWERIQTIYRDYIVELEGKINPSYFWGSPGGGSTKLHYKKINSYLEAGYYTDTNYTKRPNGAVQYYSSINNTDRSFTDILIDHGFISTMAAFGGGYAYYALDSINRLEAQRIYKKNGLKKPNNVGDGFFNSMRLFDNIIPEDTILAFIDSVDMVRTLYDYTYRNIDNYPFSPYIQPSAFNAVVDEVSKFIAWGTVPEMVQDSYDYNDVSNASYIMVLEAFYQYCNRVGIKVISHEEATLLGLNYSLSDTFNFFPNYEFKILADSTYSNNTPVYPDGWNGGVVDGVDTSLFYDADGKIFIRQYSVEPDSFLLTFEGQGISTMNIREVKNNDVFNSNNGDAFSVINTININSIGSYTEYIDTIVVVNNPLEIYAPATTPEEEAYQNYFKGYGEKICGVQIELILTGGNTINIKKPTLIKL